MKPYEMENVDPRILKYLMEQRQRPVAPDNALMAGMMKASSSLGTLGGRSADTSSADQYAQSLDQNSQIRQQGADARQAKIANYLAGIKEQNNARTEKLADYKMHREDKLADKKSLISSQEAVRQRSRREDLEDSGNKLSMSYDQKVESSVPMSYDNKVRSLNSEKLKRFDSSAMGLNAVVDMQKALKSGANTFSLVGDNPYTMSLSKFEESLGRMQSGGAITSDEVEKFKKMAPMVTDSTPIQRQKMNGLITEMSMRVSNLGFDPQEVLKKRAEYSKKYQVEDWGDKIDPDTAMAAEPKSETEYEIGDAYEKDGISYKYLGNDMWEEFE